MKRTWPSQEHRRPLRRLLGGVVYGPRMPPADRARPVVLLPPSKGKAVGGRGRAYARTLAGHPLRAARRAVLDAAIAAAARLDEAQLLRHAGVVAAHGEGARRLLAGLAAAPTLPAHRRYTGVVHRNAGLADVDPSTAAVDVRIVSPLLGLVPLDGPVPEYRLEFAANLPGVGALAAFWRTELAEHLAEVGADARVWDLLPAEHARVWAKGLKGRLDVVDVRFVRPDGRPANAARTKVAKGRLVAGLLVEPDLSPARLAARRGATERATRLLGEGWTLEVAGTTVAAICRV